MANVKTRDIDYESGAVRMTGSLAWDADADGPRPGILVVHEWWGCNEYACRRASDLAEAGYTAMAVDLYGGAQTAANPDEAGALMQDLTSDMPTCRARFEAALAALCAQPEADATRTGAIGFCLGGGVVLHMARVGVPLDVVASFHGALKLAVCDGVERVGARVVAYNGEADSFVPPEEIQDFLASMEAGQANCQLVQLPGALHGFSNPKATANGQKYGLPLAYNALADRASWSHMLLTFEHVFGD